MPRFLNTEGNASIAIFICDRCKMKRPHAELSKDPNFPGLMVCEQGCKDQFDPYRLPARKTERITLRFPRPDESVADDPTGITTNAPNEFVISPEQNVDTPEQNGNLDNLSPSP
jgi:hypothetical protein